jgi:hypothetical protein
MNVQRLDDAHQHNSFRIHDRCHRIGLMFIYEYTYIAGCLKRKVIPIKSNIVNTIVSSSVGIFDRRKEKRYFSGRRSDDEVLYGNRIMYGTRQKIRIDLQVSSILFVVVLM